MLYIVHDLDSLFVHCAENQDAADAVDAEAPRARAPRRTGALELEPTPLRPGSFRDGGGARRARLSHASRVRKERRWGPFENSRTMEWYLTLNHFESETV